MTFSLFRSKIKYELQLFKAKLTYYYSMKSNAKKKNSIGFVWPLGSEKGSFMKVVSPITQRHRGLFWPLLLLGHLANILWKTALLTPISLGTNGKGILGDNLRLVGPTQKILAFTGVRKLKIDRFNSGKMLSKTSFLLY